MHYIDTPINKLPIFVKDGAIIPICASVGSHSAVLGDTLEWHLYNGASSEFSYYEDDGESYAYESGNSYHRMVRWDGKGTLTFHQAHDHFNTRFNKYRICLHGFEQSKIRMNGSELEVTTKDIRLVEPVPSFDPLNKELDYSLTVTDVQIADFESVGEENRPSDRLIFIDFSLKGTTVSYSRYAHGIIGLHYANYIFLTAYRNEIPLLIFCTYNRCCDEFMFFRKEEL